MGKKNIYLLYEKLKSIKNNIKFHINTKSLIIIIRNKLIIDKHRKISIIII
jgi:hypothetical protein